MSDVGSCSQLTPAYHGRSQMYNMYNGVQEGKSPNLNPIPDFLVYSKVFPYIRDQKLKYVLKIKQKD